ncbi:hemolysin III family protein [Kangiella sp. HZ709]|uniref:PAQR family membrane homeostasis protein TrhA n=1 Tax=Kangiella sp. HZ709 TaxID=2666328 RepID=UPI0012AF31AD|nr:hemolysin III family protein [Kangiella sp. HZ709]MRX26917.1 hemolysin III family protein [Kangiella sp. HZ709]
MTETITENIEEPSFDIYDDDYQYSHGEEVANSISHALGAFLGVAALTMMIMIADDGWKLASGIVYGISLIILFTSSTLYHSFRSAKVKKIFKTLDHCAIYTLIAGTYTPYLLISLNGAWGWWLFGVIWLLAVAGIIFKLKFKHRFPKASLIAYILMGWIVVIAIFEMLEKVPAGGLWLLLAGGLSYTFGTIFYAADGKIPYNHAIWHLFVLGGAVCHFLSIYIYVF